MNYPCKMHLKKKKKQDPEEICFLNNKSTSDLCNLELHHRFSAWSRGEWLSEAFIASGWILAALPSHDTLACFIRFLPALPLLSQPFTQYRQCLPWPVDVGFLWLRRLHLSSPPPGVNRSTAASTGKASIVLKSLKMYRCIFDKGHLQKWLRYLIIQDSWQM